MKKLLYLSVLVIAITLAACSGEDKQAVDRIPPYPPTLIPHLGDTGDLPTSYYGESVAINEDNNGIDAVPEGNWLRIMWKPFIDNDLSHIRVYRFDEYNPNPTLLDSIPASRRQYLDSSASLNLETVYSYFIDLVDFSGNYSVSDTVSYALLGKCNLISPAPNQTVSPGDIRFVWTRNGFATKYRAVVFDESYNYVWHQDLVYSFYEDPLEIIFPVNLAQQYSGRYLTWRIDSFDWNNELQMYVGSESYERVIYVQ